jgi:hypothetical protein
MMYYIFLTIVSLLASYGFIKLLLEVRSMVLHIGNADKYVVVPVKCEDAECVVRCMLRENPASGIIVINEDASPETEEILRKFERDYPQVHIV